MLVKVEDLPEAVRCLQSFCMIQTESGEELVAEGEADNNVAPSSPKSDDTGDLTEDEAVAVHQHVLSIPNIDLHLVQMNRSAVKRHMFALVQLLFCHGRRSTNDPLAEAGKADQHFLSYSETAEGVSVVTSDTDFLEQAKVLASRGDEGVSVSPDDWKVVQIGATKLGFTETGIVAGQTRVLVNAGTMVFYISTYATVRASLWCKHLSSATNALFACRISCSSRTTSGTPRCRSCAAILTSSKAASLLSSNSR